MSGEQAEERTAREWLDKNYSGYGKQGRFAAKGNGEVVEVADLLAAYAEVECSRLASRVEELENLIAKHSGSLNSADSALNTESSSTAKETR